MISSYMEHIGGTPRQMFKMVDKKITRNVTLMFREMDKTGLPPRDAAMRIAVERVMKGKWKGPRV